MDNFTLFLVFVLTFISARATVVWIVYQPNIENLYNQHIKQKNKPDTLCDIPTGRKIALCNYILNRPMETANSQRVYFSTAAFYYLAPKCEKNRITFVVNLGLNERKQEQAMFPCYGRHDPIRTHWATDDNFDYIYLSEGPVPEENSVSIYRHYKTAASDQYILAGVVKSVNIDELPFPGINFDVVTEELKLLERVSRNSDVKEIEINYVRELINAEIEILDPVCDLDGPTKYLLCQKIALNGGFQKFILNFASFNEESTACTKEKLYFWNVVDLRGKIIEQKMYPCFGSTPYLVVPEKTQMWYLSSGFRENSVIVYKRLIGSFIKFFQFAEFYENINFESLTNLLVTDKYAASAERGFSKRINTRRRQSF